VGGLVVGPDETVPEELAQVTSVVVVTFTKKDLLGKVSRGRYLHLALLQYKRNLYRRISLYIDLEI
jgi:hypothetical protein